MASTILVKRSTGTTVPSSLEFGELGLTVGTGTQVNRGDRVFVGDNNTTVQVIGGKYFTDMLDHVHGVLTANSGIINDKEVLIANFKYEERRGEEELYSNWFSENGYSVGRIPSEYKFEGRGDAFVYGKYLIGSYGIRSDKEALLYIAEKFDLEPVIVELAQEKFYHLDTCFQQFPTGDAIYYPDAFKDSSLSAFESLFNLIPVSEHDANQLACNAVVINNTVIFPSENIEAIKTVEGLGLNAAVADVSEFLKSGGACQCLVIALN